MTYDREISIYEMRKAGHTFKEIGEAHNISGGRARELYCRIEERIDDELYAYFHDDRGLAAQLHRLGYHTMADVMRMLNTVCDPAGLPGISTVRGEKIKKVCTAWFMNKDFYFKKEQKENETL